MVEDKRRAAGCQSWLTNKALYSNTSKWMEGERKKPYVTYGTETEGL